MQILERVAQTELSRRVRLDPILAQKIFEHQVELFKVKGARTFENSYLEAVPVEILKEQGRTAALYLTVIEYGDSVGQRIRLLHEMSG